MKLIKFDPLKCGRFTCMNKKHNYIFRVVNSKLNYLIHERGLKQSEIDIYENGKISISTFKAEIINDDINIYREYKTLEHYTGKSTLDALILDRAELKRKINTNLHVYRIRALKCFREIKEVLNKYKIDLYHDDFNFYSENITIKYESNYLEGLTL